MAPFMFARRITCMESTMISSMLKEWKASEKERDIWYKISWRKCLVTSGLL